MEYYYMTSKNARALQREYFLKNTIVYITGPNLQN
jgi:hypothetical protein